MSTNIEGDYIVGSYEGKDGESGIIDGTDWKDMPHVALANILTHDEQGKAATKPEPGLQIAPKAVEQFVRTYGVLFRWAHKEGGTFAQRITMFAKGQDVLRRSWLHGTTEALQGYPVEQDFDETDFELSISPAPSRYEVEQSILPSRGHYEFVSLTTDNLWKFIWYLFRRDYFEDKNGVCENRDCPAPYFVKKRIDQKFCESGPCTQAAHRESALKWWNKVGQRRRAKKHGKPPRRKRR